MSNIMDGYWKELMEKGFDTEHFKTVSTEEFYFKMCFGGYFVSKTDTNIDQVILDYTSCLLSYIINSTFRLETRQLPVHFVSGAGLVYKDDKVLLMKSKKRGWEIPGGVVEQGESILDGLKREISEESGVIAEAEKIAGIYQRLSSKPGYGPLEGMLLPTIVNLTFYFFKE